MEIFDVNIFDEWNLNLVLLNSAIFHSCFLLHFAGSKSFNLDALLLIYHFHSSENVIFIDLHCWQESLFYEKTHFRNLNTIHCADGFEIEVAQMRKHKVYLTTSDNEFD